MKKLIVLSILSIFIVGCGSDSPNPNINEIDETSDQNNQVQDMSEEEEQILLEQEEDTQTQLTINDGELTLEKCNQFNDQSPKQSCQDNYYFQQAEKEKDSTICENIIEPQIRDMCVLEVDYAASLSN